MTSFSPNFSGFKTKPESRCGRSPTVVRITRSHEMRGTARLSDTWPGLADAAELGVGGDDVPDTALLRTAHPVAKPTVAVTPAIWRKSRRLTTIRSKLPLCMVAGARARVNARLRSSRDRADRLEFVQRSTQQSCYCLLTRRRLRAPDNGD